MTAPRRDRNQQFVTPKLAYGFVGLVALSSGLMAGAGGATLPQVGLFVGFGVVVGAALLLAIGIRPWQE